MNPEFFRAAVLKDTKTLVKRRWSYKVRITVYMYTLGVFARHDSTDTSSQIFDWKQY